MGRTPDVQPVAPAHRRITIGVDVSTAPVCDSAIAKCDVVPLNLDSMYVGIFDGDSVHVDVRCRDRDDELVRVRRI